MRPILQQQPRRYRTTDSIVTVDPRDGDEGTGSVRSNDFRDRYRIGRPRIVDPSKARSDGEVLHIHPRRRETRQEVLSQDQPRPHPTTRTAVPTGAEGRIFVVGGWPRRRRADATTTAILLARPDVYQRGHILRPLPVLELFHRLGRQVEEQPDRDGLLQFVQEPTGVSEGQNDKGIRTETDEAAATTTREEIVQGPIQFVTAVAMRSEGTKQRQNAKGTKDERGHNMYSIQVAPN